MTAASRLAIADQHADRIMGLLTADEPASRQQGIELARSLGHAIAAELAARIVAVQAALERPDTLPPTIAAESREVLDAAALARAAALAPLEAALRRQMAALYR